MHRGLIAVAALVMGGAVAVGAWGVKDIHPNRPQVASPSQPSLIARPVSVPAPVTGDVVSLPPPPRQTPPQSAAQPQGTPPVPSEIPLSYRRLMVNTENDTPEACLLFSTALDGSGNTRYQDYLSLPNGLKPNIRVDAARLCLSGLPFGVSRSLTLRQGLPAADGSTLAQAVTVEITLGDRPALVSFGPGFILPREAPDGLPVTTVNMEKLDMKVYRVGDRLLARMRADLVDERTTYPYAVERVGEDEGRLVWQGSMPTSGTRNESAVNLFPLGQVIGQPEPGLYLVTAEQFRPDRAKPTDDDDHYDYRTIAAQWVVQSDLGLTSFKGADGLTLVVRSLGSAKPIAGARLTLIARNNDELAQAVTDQDGKAHFAAGFMAGQGGMAPVMIMAYDRNDFNFLDLRRADFDLSDRGVDGRAPAPALDAFLYSDRGIYRPGESVELVAMARDPAVTALENRTLIVKVMRPDGREYRRFSVTDQGAGSGHVTIPLPAAAARGTWALTAHTDPDSPPVGTLSVEVQDFVPQRLALTVGAPPPMLRPGDQMSVAVEGRFLYGAPAAGLNGEAELSLEADPRPFPQYKGYRWGVESETYRGERVTLTMDTSDDAGKTMVQGELPTAIRSSLPLRADVSVAMREPGGRTTGEHLYIPVRPNDVYVGIHPLFDGIAALDQDAKFEVIAVDAAGAPVAKADLRYRLFRDTSSWQWYRSGSQWAYQRITREDQIADGNLTVSGPAAGQVHPRVSWGSYRLEVTHPQSGAVTSTRFYAGWYGNASADRPDRLPLAADQPSYALGATARLHVDADADSWAQVVIAGEKVHETRSVHVPAGGTDIPVEVKPEWGPGAYALVTLYRPLKGKVGRAPVRAVGAVWLAVDASPHTLSVSIGSPELTQPRRQVVVPVKVDGGSHPFITLAAVDQGILQLTRFKTPSPTAHYLAKRNLGVTMRDDYGRLIQGDQGVGDDQGGDAFGGKGLDVVPTRTVALFSGPVAVGADGIARIPLDIPDFQGELRLMAVAFDRTKVGSADARMTVRDPLVADLILPRFLSPGDQALATVLIHNVSGAAGDYRLSVTSQDAAQIQDQRVLTLPVGKREIFTLPLTGKDIGIGTVRLSLAGPDGWSVSRDWPIQIRPAQLPDTRQTLVSLKAGTDATLDSHLLDGLLPGTGHATLSVSRWQGLDVPGLLRWLDRYPYGCLEQTTSRALPLLYFNDMALLVGKPQDPGISGRVQSAVDRVLSMQTATGEFNMWGQWGGSADEWLSVFALDFLYRAQEKNYDVPQAPLVLGRSWLANHAAKSGRDEVKTYALALLARQGRANASDLRYLHDRALPTGALALAQLGAALDAVGERARAQSAFDAARKALSVNPKPYQALPYGSHLRDVYAVAAIMAGSGRSAQVPAILEEGAGLDGRVEFTTTQDKAWMLMAAAETVRNAGKLAVSLDGHDLGKGDPLSVALGNDGLARGLSLRNTGETDLFQVVSVEGISATPLPALAQGMTLTKQLFTLDGRPADLGAIHRNDRLVVVLSGAGTEKARGDYALLDLLPAGLEIESALRPEQPGFAWLGELSEANSREARDDRLIATLSLPNYRMDRSDPDAPQRMDSPTPYAFKVAYVVRAVTAGSFTLPAAVGEHMYVPRIKARTDLGQIQVGE